MLNIAWVIIIMNEFILTVTVSQIFLYFRFKVHHLRIPLNMVLDRYRFEVLNQAQVPMQQLLLMNWN